MLFFTKKAFIFCLLLMVICSCENVKQEIGMVFFKGEKVAIGCEGKDCKDNEVPIQQMEIKSFYLDKHPVTVSEFEAFVKKTNFKTDADKLGDAGVFDLKTGYWDLVIGANWEYPQGKSQPKAIDNHPVTQVSWDNACAYCTSLEKRLPTEYEWEFAAKSEAGANKRFIWGNQLKEGNVFKANVWQGDFPDSNTVADGFLFTSPVGHFGRSQKGLTDMGGNVWNWCSDPYKMYPGNPTTIEFSEDNKVIKGGSFLCDSNVCFSYRMSARNFCSKETALMHIGFRCAKSLKNK
jgi:sulfatase modifying factor 1